MNEQRSRGEIVVYQSRDGLTRVDVRFGGETVWLSLDQLAQLFGRNKSTISRHLKNIFEDGELDRNSVVANYATTAADGKTYHVDYYNLDAIISVGYRVRSSVGTQFRQWATARLKEYMQKGFTLDDERLKGTAGGDYWKELLARIRDIRSSEKMLYRQVLDLYATSTDYDPHSAESIRFFKIVQNKLHYAAHGHTAAEIIYHRANAEQPFMGLRTFKGDMPVQSDVGIAKNYLDEPELHVLNNLVSGYFDIAEIAAIEHRPMTMNDYIQQLDAVLSSGGRHVLQNAGTITHQQAIDKAQAEYRKYQAQTLSPVEEVYLETIRNLETTAKKKQGHKS